VIVQRIEFRLVETPIQGNLGVESLERIEIATLKGVIERLAEIEVPQVAACRRTGSKSQGQAKSDKLS